ncbi:MAG: radical SAM protein [Pyrobaculum sp.]
MEAYRRKIEAARRLRQLISEEERGAAASDHHAKRPPRPCGITVHTGVGCPLACTYCYIYDMGFPGVARPYKLTPLQMAYAIVLNPHVAVGEWGSLIAVGSVTEPFLPETRELALGYIKAFYEHLGNPIQVSTKMPPPPDLVNYGVDVLISVTDLSGRLEPKAPPPIERLRAGAEIIKKGGNATLFVRPIVPGVTDKEVDRLLSVASELGFRRVVFGTLRVTESIVKRLRAFGVDVTPYLRGLDKSRQIPIKYPKERFVKKARDLGLEVLPASCASNVVAHGQACALCSWGPCGDVNKLKVDEEDVKEYLETRGYKSPYVHFDERVLTVSKIGKVDKTFLEQATRVRVVLRR